MSRACRWAEGSALNPAKMGRRAEEISLHRIYRAGEIRMTTTEKISVFTFISSIAVIYLLEICLVASVIFNLLTTARNTSFFFSMPALLVHFLATAGVICFAYGRFIEPYWLEVKNISIKTEKLTDTSFRIVHVSDLHCDKKLRNETKVIKLINDTEPDVIVFTGDTLNFDNPQALPLFKETMKSLKAKLAKLAVRGNVDVWYLPNLDFFGGSGFEELDHKTIKLQKNGETIYISGLNFERPEGFRELLEDVPDSSFSILLYHTADLVEDLQNLNVDLYLSGHTHGGQVRLPFFGALTTLSKFGKKYEAGMYTVGKTKLYINRGIGLEGGSAPQVRFLARPEITVFNIEPDK